MKRMVLLDFICLILSILQPLTETYNLKYVLPRFQTSGPDLGFLKYVNKLTPGITLVVLTYYENSNFYPG